MKKLILYFFILVAVWSIGQTGPRIEFKNKENSLDFGTVSKILDKGIRSFEFENTGDSDLIVYKVVSTTGCSIMNEPCRVFKAGEKGVIDIKCNLAVGTIRKTVVVECNAVNVHGGVVKLTIKGNVVEDF